MPRRYEHGGSSPPEPGSRERSGDYANEKRPKQHLKKDSWTNRKRVGDPTGRAKNGSLVRRFTVDRLVSIINRLGSRVEVRIKVRRAETVEHVL